VRLKHYPRSLKKGKLAQTGGLKKNWKGLSTTTGVPQNNDSDEQESGPDEPGEFDDVEENESLASARAAKSSTVRIRTVKKEVSNDNDTSFCHI